MTERKFDAAQHEAAHVVVGVALGLRLRKVALTSDELEAGWTTDGFAWFTNHGAALAHAIMYAAGVVWERAHGRESPLDYRYMVTELNITEGDPGAKAAETRTCLRLAKLLLSSLSTAHSRVTKALIERDLNARDISKLARGERLDSE